MDEKFFFDAMDAVGLHPVVVDEETFAPNPVMNEDTSAHIIRAFFEFRDFVQGIRYSENLDADLGQANVLLDAVRREIDKVWDTERNRKAVGFTARATGRGREILAKLGLLREQPQETERRA